MNAVQTAAGILTDAGISVYTKFPEFGKGGTPDLFCVVSCYENTAQRSDGVLLRRNYYITVSVIGQSESMVDSLKEDIIILFEAKKIRYGGCRNSEDEDFPKEFRRDIDFVLTGD
jgi:hypothetical protein